MALPEELRTSIWRTFSLCAFVGPPGRVPEMTRRVSSTTCGHNHADTLFSALARRAARGKDRPCRWKSDTLKGKLLLLTSCVHVLFARRVLMDHCNTLDGIHTSFRSRSSGLLTSTGMHASNRGRSRSSSSLTMSARHCSTYTAIRYQTSPVSPAAGFAATFDLIIPAKLQLAAGQRKGGQGVSNGNI
jgi:hypothetical protein